MGKHIQTIIAGGVVGAIGLAVLQRGDGQGDPNPIGLLLLGIGLIISEVGIIAAGVYSGMSTLMSRGRLSMLEAPNRSEPSPPGSSRPPAAAQKGADSTEVGHKVASWLDENPDRTPAQIADGTGLPVPAVRAALRDLRERRRIADGENGRVSLR